MNLKKMTKELVPSTIGLIGGSVAADFLDKPLAEMNPYLRNGGKIVIGAVVMALSKNKILSGVGGGMIANGGSGIVKEITGGGSAAAATSGLGFTDNAIGEDWQPTYEGTAGMGFAGVNEDNAIGAVDEIGGDDII